MAYTTIDDPSAYFQTVLYTGTGNQNNSVVNDGNSDLQPDLIWMKSRSNGYSHYLVDSSRGRDKGLYPDGTNSEVTASTSAKDLQSFDTDGFTVGEPEDANSTNATSSSSVAWQWKANSGTTASNTDGDITSTVQVNADAGFSIVTDSPTNNTARSIGHGLGVAPQVVIRRARTRVENWRVFHSAAGSTGSLTLDNETAYNSSTTLFTGVTSTTFGVGTDFSVNGNYSYVSYCFAEKQGYSKFGKYVGNGNANGTFVYTGFKPAWIMVKNITDSGVSWMIQDHKRDIDNPVHHRLKANDSAAEATNLNQMDFLSNGFKCRVNDSSWNLSGKTYIYMAFAENPFVTSTGVPTTAR